MLVAERKGTTESMEPIAGIIMGLLMFPVFSIGLTTGLIVPAMLFALFHLAGFYYFPGGLQPWMQVGLFAAFLVDLFIYLWTENVILVAIAHNIGGSVGLAVNGTLFNQVDEMLIVTAIIMIGLFAYMITYEIRHQERPYNRDWWLRIASDK